MEYRNQHFVTEAYLKEWCDPNLPEKYEPYIWMISKKDRSVKNKAPQNVFSETDFYTVREENGVRNVDLEKYLQKVETEFVAVFREKIKFHQPLNALDMLVLSRFISSMYARVKRQRNEMQELWQEFLDDHLPTEDQSLLTKLMRRQASKMAEQPLPFHVIKFMHMTIPHFINMNCEILETETTPGFITSDNPCFIFDPALAGSNIPKTWDELFTSSTFELLLPLSPKQIVSLKVTGPNRYTQIDGRPELLSEVNKLIAWNADEFIISNQEKYDDAWFEHISS